MSCMAFQKRSQKTTRADIMLAAQRYRDMGAAIEKD